jgi:hypothetical protein
VVTSMPLSPFLGAVAIPDAQIAVARKNMHVRPRVVNRQFCSQSWKAPTMGADGTSPKTCITTVDMAIDNGLNTGVTHRNVTKFTGPWVAKRKNSPIAKRGIKTAKLVDKNANRHIVAPNAVDTASSLKPFLIVDPK